MKVCRVCGESKGEGEFYSNGRGGLRSTCKACCLGYQRVYDRKFVERKAFIQEYRSCYGRNPDED